LNSVPQLEQVYERVQHRIHTKERRNEIRVLAIPRSVSAGLSSFFRSLAESGEGHWSTVTIQSAKKDHFRLPAHLALFLTRSSSVSGTTRSASNPINALLSYLYAILETEARMAILTMGLDPGMGILHPDQMNRDSFVFDVIAPLHPMVDGYLLTLLAERTFTVLEFCEARQGGVRLMPPLPQALAEVSPRLTKLVAPVVEQVVQRLSQGQGTAARPLTVPMLLTGANRSRGRDRVRTTAKKTPIPDRLLVPAACRDCGVSLDDGSRMYCDVCLPGYQEAQTTAFSDSGRAKLAELRATGKDPSKGGQAKAKRGRKNSQHMQEQAAWEAQHGTNSDPEVFRREILPRLQGVPLGVMTKVTGLSHQYCSLIRRGLYVPHQRHWELLVSLAMREVSSSKQKWELHAKHPKKNLAQPLSVQQFSGSVESQSNDTERIWH
jgi:hypothetical protein